MNIDPEEIAKFDDLAKRWWEPRGPLRTLHDINPLRLQFIQKFVALSTQKVLDVGCGGGILSEAMAHAKADVTGIDLSENLIKTAQKHAQEQNLSIHYQQIPIDVFASKSAATFDVVSCLELLEHVPDPAAIIMACAMAVAPGGIVFFSTLNRNPKAYLHAIVGAEYLLKMLPKGTHDYAKFIKPSELNRMAQSANLELIALKGMQYHVLDQSYYLSDDVSVNYLAAFRKRL